MTSQAECVCGRTQSTTNTSVARFRCLRPCCCGILAPAIPPPAQAAESNRVHTARARALAQRVSELAPDLPLPINVSLERDRLLRAANRFEHRWKNLITILIRSNPVSADDLRAKQTPHRAQELGAADVQALVELIAD